MREIIVHAIVLVCLLVSGFLRGFTGPIVMGMVGVLLVHYRRDFIPGAPRGGVGDAPSKQEFEELKAQISKLNMAMAFRKPKQAGEALG